MLHVRTDVASECVGLRIQTASGRTRDQNMMRDSGRGHPMGRDGASNRTLGGLETGSREAVQVPAPRGCRQVSCQ